MPPPIRGRWLTRPGWSEFGAPRPGSTWGTHQGFDYYVEEGEPIYARGDGQVISRGVAGGHGNFVDVQYAGGVVVRSSHMQSSSPLAYGARVTADSIIGGVGKTGNAAGIVWYVHGRTLRHLHEEMRVHGRLVDPLPSIRPAGSASTPIRPAAPTTPAPATPPPIGDEMLIYANLTTNMWAAGIPFGGVWQGIPASQGDAYVKTSGRDLVRLSGTEFTVTAAICRQLAGSDVRVYADTGSNVWYLIGAGADYEIPAGRGGLFEAIYGTRIAMGSVDITSLRAAFGPLPASAEVAGIIAAINALEIPTAPENGQAARDAIVR